MLEVAETIYEMRQRGGRFTEIPDALASKLRKLLPPTNLPETPNGTENEHIALGFLEHSVTHFVPMIEAESMADTGYLPELLGQYQLILLPPKEISTILTEYGKRCALDPAWKEKYKGYRKVCGFYLRPVK
jgi:hypothetical protein